MLLKIGVSIFTAYNVSYNTITRNDYITMGLTAGMNAKLFDKKLTTGFSFSYNFGRGQGSMVSSVVNIIANASYKLFKKHAMNLSVINQNRQVVNKGSTPDYTVTFGYNYSFY